MSERPVIVFDVNETLLDLDSIRGGVIDLLESRFSVDETVKRHKPAQEAYQSVAAALILREGNAPLDVGPQPDYIGKDLDAIADQLMERYPATSGLR
jgi:2-haloacid dehalogenase